MAPPAGSLTGVGASTRVNEERVGLEDGMQKLAVMIVALLVASVATAQVRITSSTAEPTTPAEPAEQAISHVEFAELLLQVLASAPDPLPKGEDALTEVKRMNFVPQTWTGEHYLTQGEFADVLARLGGHYTPTDRDAVASRPFVEAVLRREMLRLRDYPARRMGVGDSLSHIMDEGVDRGVVSPSDFD